MAHGESGIFTSRIPMGMHSAVRNSSHQQQPQRLCSAPRIRTAIYIYNSTIIMAINACHAETHTQITLYAPVQAGGGCARGFYLPRPLTHSILTLLSSSRMSWQTVATGVP